MLIRIPSTRILIAVAAFAVSAACTTTQTVDRYDGRTEFEIACGQAVDWSVCHDEAKKRCPYGYDTLSQDIGFTAKQLRVLCYPAPKAAASVSAPAEPSSRPTAAPTTKPRKVFMTSEPHSLLLEDMARKMIDDPALSIVDDRDAADIVVKIEAYNFDFSDAGADAQHYSLGKYQVPNLVGAALYMPEASSYNIDIQRYHAEAAYEFAYTVLTKSGSGIGQKVIRDHIERSATQCSQPTINNAFGGVVPAQFWASDQLQAECAHTGERPTKSDLQVEAERNIGRLMIAHLIGIEVPEPPKKEIKSKRHKQVSG